MLQRQMDHQAISAPQSSLVCPLMHTPVRAHPHRGGPAALTLHLGPLQLLFGLNAFTCPFSQLVSHRSLSADVTSPAARPISPQHHPVPFALLRGQESSFPYHPALGFLSYA